MVTTAEMKSIFVIFCIINAFLTTHGAQHRFFDDYLSSLDDEQARLISESDNVEGSGVETNFEDHDLPIRTGLAKSKEVTCCSLGHLAGDKGYHCVSHFYAARVLERNQNRAHNRKVGFHGPFGSPAHGARRMRTFERCVATAGGPFFHKCCHHAALLRKSRPHFDSLRRRMYEAKMAARGMD